MSPLKTQNTEIILLLKRFSTSKAFSGISEIDRSKINKLISAGDEKTCLAVKKFIDDDDETRKYLYNLVEKSVEDSTKFIIRAFKVKKISHDKDKDHAESQIAGEILMKELFNT